MPRKEDRPVRPTAAATARERSRNAEVASTLQKHQQRSEADIAFLDSLAHLLEEHGLAEIELTRTYGEDDELKVRLSRYGAGAAAPAAPTQLAAPLPQLPPAPAPVPEADGPGDLADAVTSPMVGTVYLSPEPDADPFVSEGARVEEGKPLLIIEAMKTMNQIPSPKSGVVKKILVQNGQPIEYGAPLMIIE